MTRTVVLVGRVGKARTVVLVGRVMVWPVVLMGLTTALVHAYIVLINLGSAFIC